MRLSLGVRIEVAHTPQGGRSWIWVRFWEKVRPVKSAAVRMKRCMVSVCVMIDLTGIGMNVVADEKLEVGVVTYKGLAIMIDQDEG